MSLAVARDQTLAVAAAVVRGEDPAGARARERGELTFGGLAELYFEHLAASRHGPGGRAAPTIDELTAQGASR